MAIKTLALVSLEDRNEAIDAVHRDPETAVYTDRILPEGKIEYRSDNRVLADIELLQHGSLRLQLCFN